MTNIVSKVFGMKGKRPRQGNGIAIFCGIVSIVTCCFSCNLAYSRYEEAREQYMRACRLIEETDTDFMQNIGDRDRKTGSKVKKPDPFI